MLLMGFSQNSSQAVTPYRKTHVRIDIPEYTVAEPPFSTYRAGNEIHAAPGTTNVEKLASGGWTLSPLANNERTDEQGSIIGLSQFTTIPALVEEKHHRAPSDLLGASVDAGVAATGNVLIAKRPPASGSGSNWGDSLTSDVAAFPMPIETSANVAMSRLAVYNGTPHRVDQPYEFTFHVPGSGIQRPDVVCRKIFGGDLAGVGGAFALTFYGAGVVTLRESRIVSGSVTWSDTLDAWRFAPPGQVMGHTHRMRIIPHPTPSGPVLEFRANVTDVSSGVGDILTRFHVDEGSPTTRLYRIFRPSSTPPLNATGPSTPRIDARQDIGLSWQVAKLRYPTNGTLVDRAFIVPFYLTNTANMVLTWQADTSNGTAVDAHLFDANTNVELTPYSSGPGYRAYIPNVGSQHYYAKFTLSANAAQDAAPILWSFGVTRNGRVQITPVSEFTGGQLVDFSISGPEADPSHETANPRIEDLKAELTPLRIRASQRVQITTEYDPNDAFKRCVLFDGYAQRTDATLKGMLGSVYPSPNWREYDGVWMGMWVRLHESLVPVRLSLAVDPNAPVDPTTGLQPAYKVTDICRSFLSYAGFLPAQIDIPDSPIRFFPTSAGAEGLIVEPLSRVADLVPKWLRDYLGAFLVWEGNATGGIGCWRARPQAVSPYRNLAAFTTSPAAGKLPHRPESYGSVNWTGTDSSPVGAFIQKRSWRSFVKPPEANCITVSGTGDILPSGAGQRQVVQFRVNHKSFNFYADSSGTPINTADPNSRDFVGRLISLYLIDPTLGKMPDAVGFIVEREFDFTAHGIESGAFVAPLVLVNDTQDLIRDPYNPNAGAQAVPVGYYRPLRIYDPVTIDGDQWLIRNCNPFLIRGKNALQMARYEVEAPNF